MMQKFSILFIALFTSFITAMAQPPYVKDYSINNLPLPSEMNNQVSMSGIKYMGHTLYFASERCPMIVALDPQTSRIIKTIPIQVPQGFEMEGISSYKDKLYLISENIAAVYEVNPENGSLQQINTSINLPPKSKNGDGMEGIATNEANQKFYLLRERNEERTQSEIYTFSIEPGNGDSPLNLKYESKVVIPLENYQWRYSDICYDAANSRLLFLKSYSKGKLRQQFLESIDIDKDGNLQRESLKNVPVTNFSEISNDYKDQDYSMNLEGITIDDDGNLYLVSDNTSGKVQCDRPAKEKTILLKLQKK